MISLQTMGAPDLRRDGEELRPILLQPKRLAVLVYLATAAPRGFHSRDTLLGLFWPELDGERARNALRQTLHFLRRHLGDATLSARGDREIGLTPGSCWCDAAEFDDHLAAGRLEDAIALYRGDFLPGFFIEEAPEAERWLETERERRRAAARQALLALVEREERAGELRSAALWARHAVNLAPADEAIARRLMAVLHRSGQPAAALEVYDQLVKRLREEFGVSPSAETIALLKAIRSGTADGPPATVAAATPVADAPPAATVDTPAAVEPAPPTIAPTRTHRARRAWPWFAAALAAVALAVGWGAARDAGVPEAAGPRAIAVLPFADLSESSEQSYLVEGIAEELLNTLASVPGLRVAARTSAWRYRGSDVGVDSIGRALGVDHIIEGSVRRQGSQLRITAKLVDARTGFQVWSQSYDRELTDLLAVQREISQAIAANVVGTPPEAGTDTVPETRSPEAYTELLQARQLARGALADFPKSIPLLESALRRDPAYARARGVLAVHLAYLAYFRLLPAEDAYRRARAEAERALADREVAEAHLALGRLADVRDRDFARAERHYARAAALSPANAATQILRARLLLRLQRADEALAAARRAVLLDPLSAAAHNTLGAVLALLDRNREALEPYRVSVMLSPGDPIMLANLAASEAEVGEDSAAMAHLAEARAMAPDNPTVAAITVFADARAGRRAAADTGLRRLEPRADVSPVMLATLHAAVGDTARAFAALERAVRQGDEWLSDIEVLTELRPLHADPRWPGLVRAALGR